MSRRRPTRSGAARGLLAVAGCLAALATGCGGTGTTGRDAFRSAADRVCVRANAAARVLGVRISAAQRGSDPGLVYSSVAALTRRRAQVARGFVDQLDALEVPDADRDDVKRWIAGQRQRQALVDQLAAAFAAREDARISRLSQRIDAENLASDAFAARYGLAACARSTA